MRRGDGSLVVFTVLSQWSVGIVVCLAGLAIMDLFAMESGSGLATPILLALLLIVASTTVSFLHLGNPVNAPKTLRNLATSWLSREILGIGLFTLCLLAVLVSGWIPGMAAFEEYLLLACSVAGLFLVWAMARVYRIRTIPAWDSGFTLLGFMTTSLSLGLVTCLLLESSGVFILAGATRTYMTGLLIAILALEMGAEFFNHRRLGRLDTGIDGPSSSRGFLRRFFSARMVAAALAFLVLVVFVIRPEPSYGADTLAWLYAAATLVILQEFTGRILFYSSYFRIGL